VDAAVRLEVNRYNGAVEPRLVLRHARPAAPGPIEIVGEPPFAAAVVAELERALEPWPGPPAGERFGRSDAVREARAPADMRFGSARAVRDARGSGIAGLLGDLVASGDAVLGLCAHAAHRAAALRDRVGGFAVTTWAALEDEPALAAPFAHVVAIDPPPYAHVGQLLHALPGGGWTHLAWGGAELAFARRVHAWELDLKAPLAELFRALRRAGTAEGAVLEDLLRGCASPQRTGRLAGRLLRVLAELGLAEVGCEPFRVAVPADPERTALERSAAYRAYRRRLEAGLEQLREPAPARSTADRELRAA
jgi:single-stranded-DNA-specific exonuclease